VRCVSSRAAFSTARSCSSPSSGSTRRGFSARSEVETAGGARHHRSDRRHVRSRRSPPARVLLGVGFVERDDSSSGLVQQSNFFGTRQHGGLQIASGSVTGSPRFPLPIPTTRSTESAAVSDVYRRDVNATTWVSGNYRTSTVGGAVRFGVPFTEYDTCFRPRTNRSSFLAPDSPQRYLIFQNQFGATILRWSAAQAGFETRGQLHRGRRQVTSSAPVWSSRRRPET